MHTVDKPGRLKDSSSSAPQPAALPALTRDQKHGMLRMMVLIRRFEEQAEQAYLRQQIRGFCHVYSGQEAIAVGTESVINRDDAVITAYRDHGHALARGMCPKACMAELLGKATGCSKGKGGSMHFFDKSKHFYGGHGIVGGQTPLGLGLAFAQKYTNTNRVTLCYLGDGAINQGVFHESLNIAALWKVPVIYIIENNLYAMGTSVARSSAGDPLVKRASGYDMAGIVANGMDVDDVRAKTAEAVNLARTESLPSIMEIRAYRYRGHSMTDPRKYRSKDEEEQQRKRDPIEIYKQRLIDDGSITEKDYDDIEASVGAEVKEAYEFALNSPDPELEEVFDDIFAPETQIDEIERRPKWSYGD